MSNTAFYIFAIVAIIIALAIMKYVVTCLMRTVVLCVLVVVLAAVYYFFVGQYNPEVRDAVEHAKEKVEKYEHRAGSHHH